MFAGQKMTFSRHVTRIQYVTSIGLLEMIVGVLTICHT